MNVSFLKFEVESSNKMTVDEKLEVKVRVMLEEENFNMFGDSLDSESENENYGMMDLMSEILDFINDYYSQYEEVGSFTFKRSVDEMFEGERQLVMFFCMMKIYKVGNCYKIEFIIILMWVCLINFLIFLISQQQKVVIIILDY